MGFNSAFKELIQFWYSWFRASRYNIWKRPTRCNCVG